MNGETILYQRACVLADRRSLAPWCVTADRDGSRTRRPRCRRIDWMATI